MRKANKVKMQTSQLVYCAAWVAAALLVATGLKVRGAGPGDLLLNVVGTNCHPATVTTNVTKSCSITVYVDGVGFVTTTVTYTNLTLTTGNGSCNIQSCPSGGNLVYCGAPWLTTNCFYSQDTLSCAGILLVWGTETKDAGNICKYATVY